MYMATHREDEYNLPQYTVYNAVQQYQTMAQKLDYIIE